jgi:CubicO group peptidase (beta-lactamase class C family)
MCLPSTGALFSQEDWVFAPDTQFGYSNVGYKILMYLLERISNQTISTYMQENIFAPLGMNHTGFAASEFIGYHAIPHTRISGTTANRELPIWNGRYMLRSSARDMGHLLIALMNQGRFEGHQLLQPNTIAMMFEKTYFGKPLKALRKGLRWVSYGLGMEVSTHGNFGHGGSTVGFTAECYFNPTSRLGYIRLSNVNAILDTTSTQWEDINHVTVEIRSLLLTHLGMIPAYDPIFVILIVVTGSAWSILLLNIWRRRRKQ